MQAKAKLALVQAVQLALDQALPRLLLVLQRQSTESQQVVRELLTDSENRMRTEIASLAEGVGELQARYEDLSLGLAESRRGNTAGLTTLECQLADARLAFENLNFELQNAVAHATGRVDGIGLETANAIAGVQNAVAHVTGRVDGIGLETANATTEMRFLIDNNNLALCQEIFELRNATQHLGSLIENAEIRLANNIGERFTQLIAENVGRLLRVEAKVRRGEARCLPEARALPAPIAGLGFDHALAMAKSDYPRQFDDWLTRLKTLEDAIAVTSVGNLAHAADPYSQAFRSFVDLHAFGTILDVGCGTMGRPVYLADLPADQLHGLEPLSLQAPFDFPVRRGISEYLPWEGGSFDTVVSATAIDHALSLDRALDELKRVMTLSGRLLMWVGSQPGTRPYEPESPNYAPADRFHLFHIDRVWFEPMLERRFTIEDRIILWTPSHEHVFYKFQIRK